MSGTGCTLFLNPLTWDLTLDVNGNIAVAQAPYQVTQDVASACRTFLGEVYYNQDAGVPYLQDILGQQPSIPYLASQLQFAAMTVPTVVSATAIITDITGRKVSGQVQFTTSNGETLTAAV